MSRTVRNILTSYQPKKMKQGGDAQVDNGLRGNRKMKPYTTDIGSGKFVNHSGREWGCTGYMKSITRYEKLTTKNANRSMKKSMRQVSKNIVREELLLK
jgi:hypothetical protein